MSTGAYGGASMAIPLSLIAICYPELVLTLFLLGVLMIVAVLIISAVHR